MTKKPSLKKPKRVRFKKEDFDWTSLKKGDIIKSIERNGPEFILKDGNKTFMGEYGIITVVSVDTNGIYGLNDGGSSVFVYMGPEKKMSTGTLMKPHKLRKSV